MKIISKTEFYKLQEGALYSDYEPCAFTSLKIKGSTLYKNEQPIDFIYEDLIGNIDAESSDSLTDILREAVNNKTSLPLCFGSSKRDGLYKEDQLFAVYERRDLGRLIKKLESLRSTYSSE